MAQERSEAFKYDSLCCSIVRTAQKHQLEKKNTYNTTNGVEVGNKGNPLLVHRRKIFLLNYAG